MVEETSNIIKQEIAALEEILREKKRALEAKGFTPSGIEEEKELLKEAVKERVERAREAATAEPSQTAAPPPVPPIDASGASISPSQVQDDPLAGLDHRDQIEELAAIAFSKGIVEAVTTARRTNNAHLLDEFHDALVDRLYDYLVQEGIIGAP